MKVSTEIVRPFPKCGPRKSDGRNHGKKEDSNIKQRRRKVNNKELKRGKRKYSGKTL
jgi:hypothetical protein